VRRLFPKLTWSIPDLVCPITRHQLLGLRHRHYAAHQLGSASSVWVGGCGCSDGGDDGGSASEELQQRFVVSWTHRQQLEERIRDLEGLVRTRNRDLKSVTDVHAMHAAEMARVLRENERLAGELRRKYRYNDTTPDTNFDFAILNLFEPSAPWSDGPEVEHGAHFLIVNYPRYKHLRLY
jgi:hypothetical protein